MFVFVIKIVTQIDNCFKKGEFYDSPVELGMTQFQPWSIWDRCNRSFLARSPTGAPRIPEPWPLLILRRLVKMVEPNHSPWMLRSFRNHITVWLAAARGNLCWLCIIIHIYVYNSTGLGHWSESMFHVFQNGGRNTHPLSLAVWNRWSSRAKKARVHWGNNCGTMGHIAKDCPSPAQCHCCGATWWWVGGWGLGMGIGPT